jgi:putative peptidoglycan lipid II flippase
LIRSSILVTFFAVSGSTLGFLVQLILAKFFGISEAVDTYFFIISLPTVISGLLAAILSFDLVPHLVRQVDDSQNHARLMGSIFIGIIFLAALVLLFGGVISKLQILALPINSPIRFYENLESLITLAWLASAFQIINSCLAAMLNSVKNCIVSALLALLPYLGMIILLITNANHPRIELLLIGLVLGTLFSTLISIYLLRNFLFPLPWKKILWKELSILAFRSPLTAMAISCFSAYAVVDAYWAPQIGDGALSSLGYAQRLIIGIGTLAVAGASAVVIPRITELNTKKKFLDSRILFLRTVIFVGLIAITLAMLTAIFSEPIVELLYGRGAFQANEVTVVSKLLQHMSFGMVAMLLSVISLRILFSFEGMALGAALIGIFWMLLYFFLSMLWYQEGVLGIGNAYSTSWVITSALILLIICIKYWKNNGQ